MPELVNSRVGSLPGTSGADGTMVWPRSAKNSRKTRRMSEVVRVLDVGVMAGVWGLAGETGHRGVHGIHGRSEARGVGKQCVSGCGSGCPQNHAKKKNRQ